MQCWRGHGGGSRFATNEKSATTLAMLGECFAEMGGTPQVVLADRMGCLKGGVVANRVIPTGEYVRFALHYRFRPDLCEAADPESKGIVENLVGYAKSDLLTPLLLDDELDLATRNQAAKQWCEQVNAAMHSQIVAIPEQRLVQERLLLAGLPSLQLRIRPAPVLCKVDKLSCVRIGSARYSVPMPRKCPVGPGRRRLFVGNTHGSCWGTGHSRRSQACRRWSVNPSRKLRRFGSNPFTCHHVLGPQLGRVVTEVRRPPDFPSRPSRAGARQVRSAEKYTMALRALRGRSCTN